MEELLNIFFELCSDDGLHFFGLDEIGIDEKQAIDRIE
jgi:hypothetical protein